LSFLLHCRNGAYQIAARLRNLVAVGYRIALGGAGAGLCNVMGIVMKKLVLATAVLAMTAGSALAADMVVKAVKAPPPPAFEPWDPRLRQRADERLHLPRRHPVQPQAVGRAYFEPRYNINKDVQLYLGVAGESISFPNRAAAEIDIYGGIRPTIGMFAFDFGLWGYLYPGGRCFNANAFPGSGIPARSPAVS